MDFELMITSFPKLLNATVITLKLLSVSLFIGLFIGLFAKLVLLRKNKHLVVDVSQYLDEKLVWFSKKSLCC